MNPRYKLKIFEGLQTHEKHSQFSSIKLKMFSAKALSLGVQARSTRESTCICSVEGGERHSESVLNVVWIIVIILGFHYHILQQI